MHQKINLSFQGSLRWAGLGDQYLSDTYLSVSLLIKVFFPDDEGSGLGWFYFDEGAGATLNPDDPVVEGGETIDF